MTYTSIDHFNLIDLLIPLLSGERDVKKITRIIIEYMNEVANIERRMGIAYATEQAAKICLESVIPRRNSYGEPFNECTKDPIQLAKEIREIKIQDHVSEQI